MPRCIENIYAELIVVKGHDSGALFGKIELNNKRCRDEEEMRQEMHRISRKAYLMLMPLAFSISMKSD